MLYFSAILQRWRGLVFYARQARRPKIFKDFYTFARSSEKYPTNGIEMISKQEYQAQAAQGYNRIPLVQELLADLDTPLSLYLKLANRPYTYLLESVVGGERFGRYSFIGLPCSHYLKVSGKHVDVYQNGEIVEQHDGNPLPFIEAFHNRFKTPEIPSLPRFTGGLVGYFGYETIYNFEHFAHRLKNSAKADPLGTPDILLMLSQELAVIDNLSGKIHLIVYADPSQPDGYERARERLEDIRTQLRQSCAIPLSLGSKHTEAVSEFGEEPFKACVDKIKDYIFAGDCMQVVPSQRMSMEFTEPYLFYYDFGDFHIVGSSPEILVRRERDDVIVRPIAGTRLRGKTPAEDLANEQDLLSDAKEIAEHVMLIDLGRNDVGRISKTGEVKVTDKMVIEKYSHVMHIVSNVEGRLKEGITNMDILAATFPAGTLSGAPKVRAMEIIEEVEPSKRGIYGGAVGVWGFNTTSEWQETQNKARAVVRAAQMVQEGLDR